MIRTQIQLDEDQADVLKRMAGQQRISMAEAIRRAVDAYVAHSAEDGRQAKRSRALAAIGAFSAGPRLSQEHDEAFAQQEKAQ